MVRGLSVRYLRLVGAALLAVPVAVGLATPAQAATTPTIAVNLTDYTGAPLPGATISLMKGHVAYGTMPDLGGGAYRSLVLPGSYQIRVRAPGGLVQYLPGQTDIANAATYTVASGQAVTLSEQLLPSGNVRVTAVDGATNAPVTIGCLSLLAADGQTFLTQRLCNPTDGVLQVVGVPLGPVQVGLDTTKTEWPGAKPITVTAGPADYRVAFDPAAALRTTVQAADDATVHPTACVHAVYPGVDESANVNCAQADGSVLIGPLPATPVQLFVDTSLISGGDPVYGAQWVGPNGGTGDQRLAARLTGPPGTATTIPAIRLDRAGAVTGTVTDDYTCCNRPFLYVRPFGNQDGLRAIGTTSAVTRISQAGATYTIPGLGPYAWPIDFATVDGGYADQWSGNAPDRYSAVPVQVVSGGTARADVAMKVESRQAYGTVRMGGGSPPAGGIVVAARNAVTGDDVAGQSFVPATSSAYTITGLNSDPVLLTVKTDAPTLSCVTATRLPSSPMGGSPVNLTIDSPTSCGPLVASRTLPPVLTSRPSAVSASSGRSDVFAASNTDVAQRGWTSAGGWADWTTLGGGITGSPTGFANPRFGTTEVYVRTAANHLAYRYLSNGTWSNWTDLGGDLAADPTVLYNPRFGTTEVYVRTSANHLAYRYWNNGWSDWIDLAGAIAASPSLIYNPRFGTTEAYVRTTANHLAYRYWNNGWSDWIDLGGDVAGTPAVLYNPRFGTTEAYARTNGGHIAYRYWNNSWSDWIDLGGTVTTDPTLVYDPTVQTTEVYTTSAGQVVENYWSGAWSGWTNLGGNAATGVAAAYNPGTTNTDVYLTTPDGYLYQRDWDGKGHFSSGWTNLSP